MSRVKFAFAVRVAVCTTTLVLSPAASTAFAQTAQATRAIKGSVRSAESGAPLAGATVELSSARFTRRLRTDDGGQFRFGAVPTGSYRLSVLRLGYAPLTQQVSVADDDADLRVQMQPDARTLGAIVTKANVTAIFGGIGAAGLSKNVNGERALAAVRGARIQVLGSGVETETDSAGQFFLEVGKPGRYMVRATSPGLVPQVYPVDVPKNKAVDASRLLDSARVMQSERPEYLWKEMDKRLNLRGFNTAIVTGDEVREYGGSLSTALQRSRGINTRGLRLTGRECVFVDGIHRPNLSVDAIRPEEVEAIEVYGIRMETTNTLANSAKGSCGVGGRQTNTNAVAFVVIWTVR